MTSRKEIIELLQMQSENMEIYDPEKLAYGYELSEIRYRDAEISMLCNYIGGPLAKGENSTIFISGPPGTGKTSTIHFVLNALAEVMPDVRMVYVNCTKAGTMNEILRAVLNGLGIRAFPSRNSQELLARFEAETKGKKTLIVLDEVDLLFKELHRQSVNSDLFYLLAREGGGRIVVGIANDTYFTRRMDPRAYSTLTKREINFPKYSNAQLSDILWDRLTVAFKKGVVAREVVDYAITKMSMLDETNGIREVLDVFKNIVQVNSDLTMILQEHVDNAMDRIRPDYITATLKGIGLQEACVLLAGIMTHKKTTNGDKLCHMRFEPVFNAYRDLCDKKGVQPMTLEQFNGCLMNLRLSGLVSTRNDTLKPGMVKMVSIANPVVLAVEDAINGIVDKEIADSNKVLAALRQRQAKHTAIPTKHSTKKEDISKDELSMEKARLRCTDDCGGYAGPGMRFIKGHATSEDVQEGLEAWLKQNGNGKDIDKYSLTGILEGILGIPAEPGLSIVLQDALMAKGLRPKIDIGTVTDLFSDGIDDEDIRSWVFDHKGAFKFMRLEDVFRASGLDMGYYGQIEDMLAKFNVHLKD